MNECQVYGQIQWGIANKGYGTGTDYSRFPLFAVAPRLVQTRRYWYWLRTVTSSSYFADVSNNGYAGNHGASSTRGVRPDFIYTQRIKFRVSIRKETVSRLSIILRTKQLTIYTKLSKDNFYQVYLESVILVIGISDMNILLKATDNAIKASSFKYDTQKFQLNKLTGCAKLQQELRNKTWKMTTGNTITITERGKIRTLTTNNIRDKVVIHALCDEILMPQLVPKLISTNCACIKGRGIEYARTSLKQHLSRYYRENKSNDGYILIMDFSKYYPNINQDKAFEILNTMCTLSDIDKYVIHQVLLQFNKQFNSNIGLDIGNQLCQSIGLSYAHKFDTYIKYVLSQKYYLRYADDSYIICKTKSSAESLLTKIKSKCTEYQLVLNMKKIRIRQLKNGFKFLNQFYKLTNTGKIIVKLLNSSIRREVRKLNKYMILLTNGIISKTEFTNIYKSWLGANRKVINKQQYNKVRTQYENILFVC